jgi:hypothetical protein
LFELGKDPHGDYTHSSSRILTLRVSPEQFSFFVQCPQVQFSCFCATFRGLLLVFGFSIVRFLLNFHEDSSLQLPV